MEQHLKTVIISQYRASLKMLGDAIDLCEDDLWENAEYHNQFWQIAYHTLFFTNLYMSGSENSFVPWKKHRDDLQNLRCMMGTDGTSVIPAYEKTEIFDYMETTMHKIEPALYHLHATEPSGFHWLPFSKLELEFYNIRHIQHHAAQLIERIREAYGKEVRWCGWNT
jgi:hypothetical protein